MKISLDLLHSGLLTEMDISGRYTLDSDIYQSTDILSLSDVTVEGKIVRRENSDFELEDYQPLSVPQKKATKAVP